MSEPEGNLGFHIVKRKARGRGLWMKKGKVRYPGLLGHRSIHGAMPDMQRL